MRKFPISLVVLTLNEERNIERCLASVPFAAEKIVIDSGSTDATCAIAAAQGARVVHQDWLGFGKQRQFASDCASHPWILMLDADETLTAAGVDEFCARLPAILDSDLAGVVLRRSAHYMGAPMRWYRPMVGEKIGRFYHRDRADWAPSLVHESLAFNGATVTFAAAFLHHHSPTLIHKQLKVLKYSELWALQKLGKQRRSAPWSWPLVFLLVFFKDYVLRRALLDGWRGLIVAYIAASYAVYKRMRHYEMSINPTSKESAEAALARHNLRI